MQVPFFDFDEIRHFNRLPVTVTRSSLHFVGGLLPETASSGSWTPPENFLVPSAYSSASVCMFIVCTYKIGIYLLRPAQH